jgi:hypothetical protein
MIRPIIRPAAEAAIADAQAWYTKRDGALSDRFVDELRAVPIGLLAPSAGAAARRRAGKAQSGGRQ